MEIFSCFGEVKNIDFPMDQRFRVGRGHCYVDYTNPDHAELAMKNMDGGQIDGQEITAAPILIPKTRPQQQMQMQQRRMSPMRGGGGGGGRMNNNNNNRWRNNSPNRFRRRSPPRGRNNSPRRNNNNRNRSRSPINRRRNRRSSSGSSR